MCKKIAPNLAALGERQCNAHFVNRPCSCVPAAPPASRPPGPLSTAASSAPRHSCAPHTTRICWQHCIAEM
eukprot:5010553-Pleurochrysis_carterae.AAC.1